MVEAGRRKLAERHGRRGERLAAWLLMLKGYRILARRARNHMGEIDLIALSPGGVVCFVEVKARDGLRAAAESLGPRQRQRIVRAAQAFIAGRPNLSGRAVRFDLVMVTPGGLPRHLRAAWRADEA